MMELDETDRDILAVLREDGRISNVDLAARVGLSPSPCLRRVRRLEEEGVILGYRALVAPEYGSRPLIESEVVDLPVVTEVHHLAGDYDYLLRVEVADLPEYDRFTRDVLPRIPGLGHVTSFVVMSTLRDDDRGI